VAEREKVQQVKAESGLSFVEARKIVQSQAEAESPLQQQHLQECNLQLHRPSVLVHKQILPGQTHSEPAPLNTFEKSV